MKAHVKTLQTKLRNAKINEKRSCEVYGFSDTDLQSFGFRVVRNWSYYRTAGGRIADKRKNAIMPWHKFLQWLWSSKRKAKRNRGLDRKL